MILADLFSFFFFLIFFLIDIGYSTDFTIVNECNFTVCPELFSGVGSAPLPTTGFSLNPSESRLISIPAPWSGRIWARKLCGSSQIECSGAGPNSPVTVAEFKLNVAGNIDLYGVSFAHGYNLPISIVPNGGVTGIGNCNTVGCAVDLNDLCPDQLRVTVKEVGEMAVACRTACQAFGTPDYCCSVEFGTPDKCEPTEYSNFFKEACQTANQYAYEDKTKPSTCSHSNYTITFCPSPYASVKNSASMSFKQEAVSVSAAPTPSVALSLSVSAVAVYWMRSKIW